MTEDSDNCFHCGRPLIDGRCVNDCHELTEEIADLKQKLEGAVLALKFYRDISLKSEQGVEIPFAREALKKIEGEK